MHCIHCKLSIGLAAACWQSRPSIGRDQSGEQPVDRSMREIASERTPTRPALLPRGRHLRWALLVPTGANQSAGSLKWRDWQATSLITAAGRLFLVLIVCALAAGDESGRLRRADRQLPPHAASQSQGEGACFDPAFTAPNRTSTEASRPMITLYPTQQAAWRGAKGSRRPD